LWQLAENGVHKEVNMKTTAMVLRSWHRLKIQTSIAGSFKESLSKTGIYVVGIAKVSDAKITEVFVERLGKICFAVSETKVPCDDGTTEVIVSANFANDFEAALDAAVKLRALLTLEMEVEGSYSSVSLARNLHAAICGLERNYLPVIHIDDELFAQHSNTYAEQFRKLSIQPWDEARGKEEIETELTRRSQLDEPVCNYR